MVLQYKIELALNGMVDVPTAGTGCAEMPVFERLRKLRERWGRLRTGTFADSGVGYLWQQWPRVASMPTDGWEASLAFGSEIAYVVVKPPQKEISVTAPPVFGQAQGSGKGGDGGDGGDLPSADVASPDVASQYHKAKSLPPELKEHCRVYLEEALRMLPCLFT